MTLTATPRIVRWTDIDPARRKELETGVDRVFFDASSVLVNNSFRGALVAPNAALQVLGGGIDGSVAVDRITAQNAEIRSSVYTGYIPAPGAASLCVLAGAVAARRRREPVGC